MLTGLLENNTGKTASTQMRQAFEPSDLMEKYADYLFRFALLRVRDESIAEDLVQETLLAAIKNMSGFINKSSERTWLTAILKNKIKDYFRKMSHEQPLDFSENEDFFEADGCWKNEHRPSDWKANPADIVENQEFWQIINHSLSLLPKRTAAAFILREIEGLSCNEICQTLDISANNLWVMLHRARLQLRREIEINFFNSAK